MMTLTEIGLDATWEHGRVVAPPTPDELERLLATLKQRKRGTLYLKTAGDRLFLMGVASRVWLAHIYDDSLGSLWLSNPPLNGRISATFDCGGTPTKIQAKLTCRTSDAVRACREFFLAPAAIPTGNWINEYTGLPIGDRASNAFGAAPPAVKRGSDGL
jgi:hypothetical protein